MEFVVLVICVTGVVFELVGVVPDPPGLECTKAPTAKPLISPERAKSRMAKKAILRVCCLMVFGC